MPELEIDKYSCGTCLHCQIPSEDGETPCFPDSNLRVCTHPLFMKMYVDRNISPYIALLRGGQKKTAAQMRKVNTTCYQFGGAIEMLIERASAAAEFIRQSAEDGYQVQIGN